MIQEDVNKYSVRKEIQTRNFPQSQNFLYCKFVLLNSHHLGCLSMDEAFSVSDSYLRISAVLVMGQLLLHTYARR